jgi:hypothetical protein
MTRLFATVALLVALAAPAKACELFCGGSIRDSFDRSRRWGSGIQT